ncbi:MAG: aldehyde dehydrogenase family protein [Bacteroidetes bacterium]|nr:aldehyde dehydrogenase family protein [Bacteroidota bacterium]
MKAFKIYCGGQFITTQKSFEVINPFDGKSIAKTWLASNNELDLAIRKAQETEKELARLPVFEKYGILSTIARQISEKKEDFTKILCQESAKPWRYAQSEVERAIQTFTVAAEESKRLPGEYMSLDWTPAGKGKEGIVRHFPIGLVAGISPFNFPLNLAVHKIAPAIAAGCPIILKPATSTPLSTLMLAGIIDQSGLPKGAISILPMDRNTGNHLVTDERFKLLSFTGSPEVGWEMKKEAGKKKTILELGGNAGVIVTESADMDLAVNKCLVGGFAYSGQVCIHAQRIYVHDHVFETFTTKFIDAAKKLTTGNPMNPDTDISAMIDEDNALRVEEWVQEAIHGGAKALLGAKREGTYFPPTVLTETQRDMKVCALEVFGPVVVLEPYSNFASAIEKINDSRYGLQAGVFTNHIDEMNVAFNDLKVGGVVINDVPTFRVDHMPYGGMKDSGLGREGVKYAMMDMMETKILVKNRD